MKENDNSTLFNEADGVEEITYLQPFTEEELKLKKERLSEVSVDVMIRTQKKQKAMEEHNQELKPLQKEQKKLICELKDKGVHVTEECAIIRNTDKKIAEYYNADGELVYSRPLYAYEYGPTINSLLRNGTND